MGVDFPRSPSDKKRTLRRLGMYICRVTLHPDTTLVNSILDLVNEVLTF